MAMACRRRVLPPELGPVTITTEPARSRRRSHGTGAALSVKSSGFHSARKLIPGPSAAFSTSSGKLMGRPRARARSRRPSASEVDLDVAEELEEQRHRLFEPGEDVVEEPLQHLAAVHPVAAQEERDPREPAAER